MRLSLGLALPRDELSIPVVRHICRRALEELGIDPECISDIEIALAEACTNVLNHAGPTDEYEVEATVDGERCVIRVIDTGHGFESGDQEEMAGPAAESGRGLGLMRALVDRIEFTSRAEEGTVVHLEKSLALLEGGAAKRLLDRAASAGEPAG